MHFVWTAAACDDSRPGRANGALEQTSAIIYTAPPRCLIPVLPPTFVAHAVSITEADEKRLHAPKVKRDLMSFLPDLHSLKLLK